MSASVGTFRHLLYTASRLPIQQQVLCALERLVRPTTLEQLAVDYDMANGSVVNVSRRVWRALYKGTGTRR
jgi:hypothetical protein